MINHIFTNYFILHLAIFSSLKHGGAEPSQMFVWRNYSPPWPPAHVGLPRPTSWEYKFFIWKDLPGSGMFDNI